MSCKLPVTAYVFNIAKDEECTALVALHKINLLLCEVLAMAILDYSFWGESAGGCSIYVIHGRIEHERDDEYEAPMDMDFLFEIHEDFFSMLVNLRGACEQGSPVVPTWTPCPRPALE